MSEEKKLTPELILATKPQQTPLTPHVRPTSDEAPVKDTALDVFESRLTPEELRTVEEFSQKIDLADCAHDLACACARGVFNEKDQILVETF